jgi:hypothetical protein
MIRRYCWIPDLPSDQDVVYVAPGDELLAREDLRGLTQAAFDQGTLGSSVANALAGAYQMVLKKQGQSVFLPARLFLYYNQRQMSQVPPSKDYFKSLGAVKYMLQRRRSILKGEHADGDTGGSIRDGLISLATQGICPETLWNPGKWTDVPSVEAYAAAAEHKVVSFERLPRNLNTIKACLAEGFPVIFGFALCECFESVGVAASGILNVPKLKEQILGGHAGVLLTYDDTYQRCMVRNSFGRTWGMSGNFTIPYAYLMNSNLVDDFWMIRSVT